MVSQKSKNRYLFLVVFKRNYVFIGYRPDDEHQHQTVLSNTSIYQHYVAPPTHLSTTFGVRNALFLSLSCPGGLDDVHNTTSVSLPSQFTFLTNDGSEKFCSSSSASDDTINQQDNEGLCCFPQLENLSNYVSSIIYIDCFHYATNQ